MEEQLKKNGSSTGPAVNFRGIWRAIKKHRTLYYKVLPTTLVVVYLIMMFDSRQRCVELSLCHLVGSVCQLLKWLCRAPDGEEAHQKSNHQHYNDNHHYDNAYHHAEHCRQKQPVDHIGQNKSRDISEYINSCIRHIIRIYLQKALRVIYRSRANNCFLHLVFLLTKFCIGYYFNLYPAFISTDMAFPHLCSFTKI